MKPYKPSVVQELLPEHIEMRLVFCQWLLQQVERDPDFPQKMIFGDEKWFHLSQSPNRQNTRKRAMSNPQFVIAAKNQAAKKILCWCGIVDGRLLPVVWFHDENGNNISVNQDRYLEMIKNKIWPAISDVSDRKGFYWCQDGSTSHTANKVLAYLTDSLHGEDRLISRRAKIVWPSHSPDLNVLDFFLWGILQQEVYRCKPQSIEELKMVVEDVSGAIPEDRLKSAAQSIVKRA